MASIGQNSLWGDLEADVSAVTQDVMGPSYSYADNIPGPSSLGVGSNGTISQLTTNTGAVIDYVKYMVSGPALGNRYFINTGGTCTASDGSTQSRYNYINNVSNGADTLPASMKQDLGGIASDFNGLLPGVLQDIEGLNPVSLFSAIAADSTPSCDCYTCQTSTGPVSQFLNTTLSPDFDPALCTKADNSACAPTKEGFTDGTGIKYLPLGIVLLAGLMLYLF